MDANSLINGVVDTINSEVSKLNDLELDLLIEDIRDVSYPGPAYWRESAIRYAILNTAKWYKGRRQAPTE